MCIRDRSEVGLALDGDDDDRFGEAVVTGNSIRRKSPSEAIAFEHCAVSLRGSASPVDDGLWVFGERNLDDVTHASAEIPHARSFTSSRPRV